MILSSKERHYGKSYDFDVVMTVSVIFVLYVKKENNGIRHYQ